MPETITRTKEELNDSAEVGGELDAAQEQLEALEGQVLADNPEATQRDIDEATGSFVVDAASSLEDGSEDEVLAAETGALRIVDKPNQSDNTAIALDAMPINSLASALQALEEGRGPEATSIVIETLDAAVHGIAPSGHDAGAMTGAIAEGFLATHELKGALEFVHHKVVAHKVERPEQAIVSPESVAGNSSKINSFLDKVGIGPALDYIEKLPRLDMPTAKRFAEMAAEQNSDSLGEVIAVEPRLAGDAEFMARHFKNPDRVARLFGDNPELAATMSRYRMLLNGAPARVMSAYDSISDPRRADRFRRSFSTLLDPNSAVPARSMAKSMVFLVATSELGQVSYGGIAHGADTTFKPEQNLLLGVPVPLESRLPAYSRSEVHVREKPVEEMDDDELRSTLRREYVDTHTREDGTIDVSEVSLADLHEETQELVLAERLEKAYEESNDSGRLAAASERNKQLVRTNGRIFNSGDLIHTTDISFTDNILQEGLICGELSGRDRVPDAFPFGVDFYKLNDADVAERFDISKVSSRVHPETSVTVVINRGEASIKEYPDRVASIVGGYGNRHVVVMGAVPSTEFKALIAHGVNIDGHSPQVRKLSAELVQRGMYAPILAESGEVLFTPEQFDAMIAEPQKYTQANQYKDDQLLSRVNPGRDPIPPWDRELTDGIYSQPAFI